MVYHFVGRDEQCDMIFAFFFRSSSIILCDVSPGSSNNSFMFSCLSCNTTTKDPAYYSSVFLRDGSKVVHHDWLKISLISLEGIELLHNMASTQIHES